MEQKIATAVNRLADFCGVRDLPDTTQESLLEKYGFRQADVLAFFGGSILYGVETLAQAIQNQLAKTYVIVGGAGHTTDTLRQVVHQIDPLILTKDRSEAEIFRDYLNRHYAVDVDFLEIRSTNCGNNITYLLELLKTQRIDIDSIVLMQDLTMQRRMSATLEKFAPEKTIINFASYQAPVMICHQQLIFQQPLLGLWKMERFISLLLGEIPRLTDNEAGYGPNGQNFIAHVEIPEKVQAAFIELKTTFPELVRTADPRYKS